MLTLTIQRQHVIDSMSALGAKFRSVSLEQEPREVMHKARLLEAGMFASRMLPRGRAALPRTLAQYLIGDRLYEIGMPGGFKMAWGKGSIDMLASLRAGDGWDDHVRDALLNAMKPGAVLYDIGANAGYMSLSVAKATPGARIYSFEPIPALAASLRASARANDFDQLQVVNAALSSTTGMIDLFITANTIHTSMVSRPGKATRLPTAAFAMDDLLGAGLLPPPDVIKIDVEGAEMLVFEGAQKTLSEYHPVLVFECDENTERFGHSPATVLTMLRGLGYDQFAYCSSKDHQLHPLTDFEDAPLGDFVVSRSAPSTAG